MCGVSFFSGNNTKSNTAGLKMRILTFFIESRGGHATGVYTDTMGIVKRPVGSSKYFEEIGDIKLKHIAMSHTRYKTHGLNIEANAHPWHIGNIIGLHNGVISNYNTILQRYGLSSIDYPVDSQAIFHLIDREGEEKLQDLSGAMAIVYTKVNKPDGSPDGRLYVQRRTNPIFVGKCKEGIYGSSIQGSLEAIGCRDIITLDEHVIYCYDKGELVSQVKIEGPKVISYANWNDYTKKPAVASASHPSSTTTSKTWEESWDDDYYYEDYKNRKYPASTTGSTSSTHKPVTTTALALVTPVKKTNKQIIMEDKTLVKFEPYLILTLLQLSNLGLDLQGIYNLTNCSDKTEQLTYLLDNKFMECPDATLAIKSANGTWSTY